MRCWFCGAVNPKTMDHLVPRSRGGRGASNKVPACQPCNSRKANMTLEEYRLAVKLWVEQHLLDGRPSTLQLVFYGEYATSLSYRSAVGLPLPKSLIIGAPPGR